MKRDSVFLGMEFDAMTKDHAVVRCKVDLIFFDSVKAQIIGGPNDGKFIEVSLNEMFDL